MCKLLQQCCLGHTFDKIITTGSVQFETVGFVAVNNFSDLEKRVHHLVKFDSREEVDISEICLFYLNVFEWDNSSGFLVCSVLEIVETIVVKDEPTSLPRFVPSTLFPQPAFAVGIKERVHQIVAIVLGNLERFSLDAVVQTLENIARQVLAIIDTTIHRYKLF